MENRLHILQLQAQKVRQIQFEMRQSYCQSINWIKNLSDQLLKNIPKDVLSQDVSELDLGCGLRFDQILSDKPEELMDILNNLANYLPEEKEDIIEDEQVKDNRILTENNGQTYLEKNQKTPLKSNKKIIQQNRKYVQSIQVPKGLPSSNPSVQKINLKFRSWKK